MHGEGVVTGRRDLHAAGASLVSAAPDPAQAKIEVRDIHKSFASRDGALRVLAGMTFAVPAGATLALVGPSGCGKSTLMKILAGFDQPDAGMVLIDGKPRGRPNPNGVVISQQGSVFPWLTVQQNLLFGLHRGSPDEKAALARHYIELVGLKGFESSYAHELSGGMLKRVEIARALAVKPDVLFMDEPFSALDALMSFRIRRELLRILEKERHTVVLITHDVEEAIHLADRIVVLSCRPTRIQATFEIPFPHPRKLSSSEVQDLKDVILRELGLGP